MNVINKSPKTLTDVFESESSTQNISPDQLVVLQGILESIPDGILIVSDTGKIIRSNRLGRRLCEQLIDRPTPLDSAPKLIWRLCKALLDSQETSVNDPSVNDPIDSVDDLSVDDPIDYALIEEDIQTTHGVTIRVRVQFCNHDSVDARILIILEDRFQTAHARAIAEGRRYGLTNREAEVWQYRCIGCTYKDISKKLFITVDTVKKHVKSIYAKRETFQLMHNSEEI
ncbi:MAG: helix-turn-helix transcriptional regulator [Cyanobacteria bacterium P01_E01_bin.6]